MRPLYPSKYTTRRFLSLTLAFSFCLLLLSALPAVLTIPAGARAAASDGPQNPVGQVVPVITPGSAYRQTNFVSDWPGIGLIQDPLLINPWGISMRNTSPFWVANAGSNTSTLYRGDVGGSPLVKNPGLSGITIPGFLPTGTVGNTTSSFVIPGPCASPPCTAQFLFASLTGNILGWNSNAPAVGSTTAVIVASDPNAVYTGLAISSSSPNRLYAADFKNGKIDVYDGSFALTSVSGGFADGSIPAGFAPYNIQAITTGSNTWLYVTYAKVGVGGRPEDGIGNGYVRRFDTDGVVDAGFAINNGPLNAPWGLTRAPASFGLFGNALLVGNFGTGNPSIHAFDSASGALLGPLRNEAGQGIVINRLWALIFGNGGNGGDPNTLYFSAGIGEEEHGLFGKLQPTTAQATSLVQFAAATANISEAGGHIDITVTRDGDTSGTATVSYATFDQTLTNHASQKTDYELAVGKLTFAPGETSKTFRILIVDDLFDENDEVIDLVLSNPTGAGLGLGSPNTAQVTIQDNDTGSPASNPIDNAQFFVRQLYLDMFNREPDAAALTFWANQITACGGNAQCIYQKRVDVAVAFLNSIEFRETAFVDVFTHLAAYGTRPLYGQFQIGTQALQRGVDFGAPDIAAQLEASKQAYFNEFVTRSEFVARYPSSQTNADFVDALLGSAGLSPTQVRLFLVNLTNAQENPPTTPTSSNGGGPRPASFGTARLQFNAAQTAMTFTSTVNNIDFTGFQTPGEANDNLTVAHIHAGPAVTPAVNGPVVWGFFGTPFNDNNPNDQVVTPFTSGVGGSVSGKWDAPEGNGTTLAAQLSNLREGRAYVNFHTVQFGGGEIRGNIPAATALRDALVAGLNGGTETRATVLRKVAEQEELRLRENNGAVALVGFFEYLRQDPTPSAFTKLVDWLNAFNGDINRETVRLFITSPEYRARFGNDLPGLFANTAPDAVDDTAQTAINTPISINVLANDTDFENVALSISSVTPGTGGTPSIVGNRVLFTPAPNFTGTASFQYTITDNGTRPFDSTATPLPDPKTDTATVNVAVSQFLPATLQFSAASYSAGEGDGRATVVVTRTIATAGAISRVDYVTNDLAGLNNCNVNTGDASARCDYTAVGGTLVFQPGETMKAITIPIINDVYVEGPEVLTITLINVGADTLGAQSSATVTITDNDAAPGAPNPIDTRSFFVRQLYLDTLNREPDPAGLTAWLNRLNNCPGPGETLQNCDEIEVASAFFRSPEFFDRSFFIYKFYEAALARQPQYDEYQRDLRRLTGFLTADELEQRKREFAEEFVNRAEFHSLYDSFGSGQPFVDAVLARAGTARPGVGAAVVVTSNRVSVINRMAASQITRGQGLRELMEAPEISQRFFNKAFVVVGYFAFLRRNPDIAYLQWINVLNTTGDYRAMIRGFTLSPEYRFRFGPN
jgi:uncharacterized protein (TIGR03118 family)